MVASARIARHFEDNPLSCGLTAYGHPLACAAIAAAIEAYRDENLMRRAARAGRLVAAAAAGVRGRRGPRCANLRGLGLLWGLDLFERRGAGPGGADEARCATRWPAQHLHLHKRDHMVFLAPPLVASEADLQAGLDRLGRALDEAFA